MGISWIVVMIVEIIIIGWGIYKWIVDPTSRKYAVVLLTILIIALVFTFLASKNGSGKLYNVAINDIGMELVKNEVNEGLYKKGNMEVSYNEKGYTYKYTIVDKDDIDLKAHLKLLNCFFNFDEGVTETLYYYFDDYYNNKGITPKILIIDNHTKLEIEYNHNTKTILYNIEQEQYVNKEEYDDNDKLIRKEYNKNYDLLYLVPELHISHYNIDDSLNFDKKLLNDLFNKSIDRFNRIINGEEIIYHYK